MWLNIAIAFTIAFFTSFMATPHIIKLAKKIGAVDSSKEERRVNIVTIPRLGGLAVILGFIISMIYLLMDMILENKINLAIDNYNIKLLGFAVGALLIAIVCFIDDIKNLPAFLKLIVQILATIFVIKSGILIDNFSIPFIKDCRINEIWIIIITMVWIIGITNAINLIDGVDGLAGGISVIACISLLIIFLFNNSSLIAIVLIIALAGSVCGFLPYNLYPAKIFLGDVGSNFIGFVLSIISIFGIDKTNKLIVIIAPVIILAIPVCDTLCAIIRRVIKRRSVKAIFIPDKNHLHHKLLKLGFTQKRIVMILCAVTVILSVLINFIILN